MKPVAGVNVSKPAKPWALHAVSPSALFKSSSKVARQSLLSHAAGCSLLSKSPSGTRAVLLMNRGGVPVVPPSSDGGCVVPESRLGPSKRTRAWLAQERTPWILHSASSPVLSIGPQVVGGGTTAVEAVGVAGGTVPPTSHLPKTAKRSLVLAKHFALPVIQLAQIRN